MQEQLIAGDSLNYETDIPDYPPSAGWTAVLRLVPEQAGAAAIKITATTSPTADRYAWQIGPAETAAWTPCGYSWAIWVQKAGARITRQTGRLVVRTDPDQLAPGTDGRSQAEVGLDAINALLLGRASTAQLRYKINGRELESYPLPDLMRLQKFYENQVAAEARARGLADPRGSARRILVRVR
jgi:hypothetical protein